MIGQLLTGRYLILEALGVGGFSETYLARDKYLPHHPLCVVKRLKLPHGSSIPLSTVQKWFETEAQLLEKLGQQHHQIPTLLAYCQEDEEVYLVQEYIEGEQLGEWLAQGHRINSKTAIALLMELLPLLESLQSQHIIHRDISLSNLIRRRRDGRIVLIDFGAAYVLPEGCSSQIPEDDEGTPLTLGTPGYMPDEQRLGMAHINSDLYALGMVVIHLLTGVHPQQFQLDPISGERDWHSYLKPKAIHPQLMAILDRMVQSHTHDRYQQASEVLADLQAIPRLARPRPRGDRDWKSVRWLGVAVTTIVVMGWLGNGSLPQVIDPALVATQINQLGQKLVHPSDLHLTRVKHVALSSGIDRMMITPDNRMLVTAGSDHVLRLWSLPAGQLLAELSGHRTKVTALSMSSDSKHLVSSSDDGTIHLWDVSSRQSIQQFVGEPSTVTAIALSPDTQTVVSGTKSGVIQCWNSRTGMLEKTLSIPNSSAVTAITYGTASNSLISASGDRRIQVWNLQNGQLQRTFAGHTDDIVGLQVMNPHTLFSLGKDRGLVWDLHQETLVLVSPDQATPAMTTSLTNQKLMTVDHHGNLQIWLRQGERLIKQPGGTIGQSLTVAVSPNQTYIASWTADQELSLWQLNT